MREDCVFGLPQGRCACMAQTLVVATQVYNTILPFLSHCVTDANANHLSASVVMAPPTAAPCSKLPDPNISRDSLAFQL